MSKLSEREAQIFREMIYKLCSENFRDRWEKRDEANITPKNKVNTLEADLAEIFCPSSDQKIAEFIATP